MAETVLIKEVAARDGLQAQPQHVPLLPALRQLQQEQLIWQQPGEQLRKAVVEAKPR